MYKEKDILIPLYPISIKLIYCDKIEEFNKKYKLDFPDEYDGLFIDMENPQENKRSGFLLMIGNTKPEVIVHELIHLKNYIFRMVNIQPDLDNDEPEAYLMTYLTKKALKFYSKC